MSPASTHDLAILQTAPNHQRQRLLELFPISTLREHWSEEEGTKEELSLSVAKSKGINEIADFVNTSFSCCKQHVYIFENRPSGAQKLGSVVLSDGERIRETGGVHLFLVKATFDVILREPLEQKELSFLWPVKIELTATNLIVRFIVLEKNVPTYFPERPYNFGGRNVDEKSMLKNIQDSLKLELRATDLHKGIKQLWKNGKIDSSSAGYKKPQSTAFEAMDGQGLIKEDNLELYKAIIGLPLFKTVFQVTSNDWPSISLFQVEPAKGIIAFLRYSESRGDTDNLVGEILRLN